MLYMEDYLEMIEHLPNELRDCFTEMREMDLSVQNRMDTIASREKSFFAQCKRLKPADRDAEFQKLRNEYGRVIEEASEKIQNAEDCYNLVDKYLRKLDQELHKFKMELEADNRGITEILEKRSLELDATSSGSAPMSMSGPSKENRPSKKQMSTLNDIMFDSLASPAPGSSASTPGISSYPLQHMGAGGNAIAVAASQAIAATQQLVPGRRTSSLKASYEAINLGVQTHEFSIGRELAGAAQTALAATPLGSDQGPPSKKQKTKRSSQASTSSLGAELGTSGLLDVVSSDASSFLEDTGLLDPSTAELLGRGGDNSSQDGSANEADYFDPAEPRYCICNQVSYGEMVACDNDDCPYEWFHYPCVGITATPKGKWYCSTCLARKKKK